MLPLDHARQPRARAEHARRPARRARRDPFRASVAAVREHRHAVRRCRLSPVVGRPARDRPLPPGVVLLRARATVDARAPVPVPAQHADPADDRRRRVWTARTVGSARRSSPTTRLSSASSSSSRSASAPGASPGRPARTACATCGWPRRWRGTHAAMPARAGISMSIEPAALEHAEGRGRAGVWIANAPVSYGAFEITVGVDPNVPDPVTLLDAVASAGYVGIDLGPPGYLGTGELLAGPAVGARARARRRLPRAALQRARQARVCARRSSTSCSTCSISPPTTSGRRGRRSPTRARPRGRRCPGGPRSTRRSASMTPAGTGSRSGSRSRSRAAATAAMSRRSTTTRRRTSRPSGRSSGCSRSRTSGCALTPVICCSAAASRSPRSGRGPIGSTSCTSRTRAWTILEQIVAEAAPVQEIWRRRAFCAARRRATSRSATFSTRSRRSATRTGSWSSRTSSPTPPIPSARRPTSGATASTCAHTDCEGRRPWTVSRSGSR